jgi:hypothetical protein
MAVLVLLQVGALFHFHFLISNVPAYIKVQYCHQSDLLQFCVLHHNVRIATPFNVH